MRAQAPGADGRTQGGGPGSSGGSLRRGSSGNVEKNVKSRASRQGRSHEKGSISGPETEKRSTMSMNVSPFSHVSSSAPSLALCDTGLSVSLSLPRYEYRSHDGSVAGRCPGKDMKHDGGSPEGTRKQITRRIREVSDHNGLLPRPPLDV